LVQIFREVGERCAMRGIVNRQVWLVQSVIVVKDAPEETVLLLLPGAQCAYPEGYAHWRKNDGYAYTRWQEARRNPLVLKEFPWETNRILIFLEPKKYYSCFLFWDQARDKFICYYINFQLPYRRSHCGFDTLDLDLDIVIDPQYNWKWKDEDEYQAGIEEGGIKEEWVRGIEASKAEVIERINERRYPLDGSWNSWQPHPEWAPPRLPEGWRNP
jgi:protein associated with RNAse G/E